MPHALMDFIVSFMINYLSIYLKHISIHFETCLYLYFLIMHANKGYPKTASVL